MLNTKTSLQRLAGRSGAGLPRTSPALLRLLGLWNPTVRSLLEMQYQFEEPFVVDSTKITDRLGVRATLLDAALDQIWVAGGRAQG